VLRLLEGEQLAAALGERSQRAAEGSGDQLPLFQGDPHPVVVRLRDLDPDRTTPLEALRVLDELARLARNA
jgi:hypothetical protein